MVDDVGGFHHARGAGLFLSGIEVAIETREIAAGDFEPEFVSREENVASGPKIDGDVINLAGIRELWFFLRIAIAQAQDAFR